MKVTRYVRAARSLRNRLARLHQGVIEPDKVNEHLLAFFKI